MESQAELIVLILLAYGIAALLCLALWWFLAKMKKSSSEIIAQKEQHINGLEDDLIQEYEKTRILQKTVKTKEKVLKMYRKSQFRG